MRARICALPVLQRPAIKETKTRTRINKKLVTFEYSFFLDEIGKELPAGGYTIETEEESINGSSFLAVRPITTTLIVRPPVGARGQARFWTIDPQGLETALEQDAERTLQIATRTDDDTVIDARSSDQLEKCVPE